MNTDCETKELQESLDYNPDDDDLEGLKEAIAEEMPEDAEFEGLQEYRPAMSKKERRLWKKAIRSKFYTFMIGPEDEVNRLASVTCIDMVDLWALYYKSRKPTKGELLRLARFFTIE